MKDRKNTQRKKQGKKKRKKKRGQLVAHKWLGEIRFVWLLGMASCTHIHTMQGGWQAGVGKRRTITKGRKFKDKPTSEQTTSGGIV